MKSVERTKKKSSKKAAIAAAAAADAKAPTFAPPDPYRTPQFRLELARSLASATRADVETLGSFVHEVAPEGTREWFPPHGKVVQASDIVGRCVMRSREIDTELEALREVVAKAPTHDASWCFALIRADLEAMLSAVQDLSADTEAFAEAFTAVRNHFASAILLVREVEEFGVSPRAQAARGAT